VKPLEKLNTAFRPPVITKMRMFLALALALVADGAQFCIGPLGWAGIDQAIDVVTMLLTMWLLGFHILLLPTFVAEFIPVVEDLPTWTACVIAVIALRKRGQNPPPPPPPTKPVIDI
jgi:hypothetical protein